MEYKNINMIGDKDSCRFLLEIPGTNPIIMIGANPSVANESRADKTTSMAMRIAERNGFDGVILLNIYAQRATHPKALHQDCDITLHNMNMDVIKNFLRRIQYPTVLICYGNVIHERKYMKTCLRDILCIFPNNTSWRKMGNLTVCGNPRHLSRLPLNAEMTDACDYVINFLNY